MKDFSQAQLSRILILIANREPRQTGLAWFKQEGVIPRAGLYWPNWSRYRFWQIKKDLNPFRISSPSQYASAAY